MAILSQAGILYTCADILIGWAISTGSRRADIPSISSLRNSKIGVSRIGSGSYVMGFVLADQQGWLSSATSTETKPPFENVPLETFEKLRNGVNDSTADFFMWEHFTSKRYYDNGEIRRVGDIYTPWKSWLIVASTDILSKTASGDERLGDLFMKLDKGVEYFESHQDEAVQYISTSLDYSEEDAREWLKTVKFSKGVKGVDGEVVTKTVDILKKAGVLGKAGKAPVEMVGTGLWR
jgi:hypothetical protein